MWQNVVPVTFLQRGLRVLLGSLFLAVAWVFASAATSFASDLSSLSDATRIVQVNDPSAAESPSSAAFDRTALDRTVTNQAVPKGAEPAVAIAKRASTATGLAEQSLAPVAALADGSLTSVETAARNVTSTVTSAAPSGVQAISKPAAAVVDSVIHDSTAAVKPVLTRAASLPASVGGELPDIVAAPALPAVAAGGSPTVEPVPEAARDLAPAAKSAFGHSALGSEQHPGEQSSGAWLFGARFSGTLPEPTGNTSGMAPRNPAGHPEDPSPPATPPVGAAGSANSGGLSNQQVPVAGTTDIFKVPFSPASELKARSSGPDPQALNRNPGFSPD